MNIVLLLVVSDGTRHVKAREHRVPAFQRSRTSLIFLVMEASIPTDSESKIYRTGIKPGIIDGDGIRTRNPSGRQPDALNQLELHHQVQNISKQAFSLTILAEPTDHDSAPSSLTGKCSTYLSYGSKLFVLLFVISGSEHHVQVEEHHSPWDRTESNSCLEFFRLACRTTYTTVPYGRSGRIRTRVKKISRALDPRHRPLGDTPVMAVGTRFERMTLAFSAPHSTRLSYPTICPSLSCFMQRVPRAGGRTSLASSRSDSNRRSSPRKGAAFATKLRDDMVRSAGVEPAFFCGVIAVLAPFSHERIFTSDERRLWS